MPRQLFTGLWRHADFMKLWSGQTISLFGSSIGSAAMTFAAILTLHATPFQLGLLSAARLSPGLLTGIIAGAWVDRLRRRPILIGADLARAVLLGTIPLAALLSLLRMEQLYAVTFLVSILTIFFDVAYESYLPSLIGRLQLVEGNSKLSGSASIAEASGFSAAGWLVQIFTAPVTILIDAISFAASAISIWMIRGREQARESHAKPDIRREIEEGWSAMLRHPLLRSTAACEFSKEFFGGMYGALVVLYMVRELGFAPGVLGTIWAVGGISSLIGAAMAGRLTRTLGMGPAMIGGLLLSSAALFLIPLARGATLAAGLLLILQQLAGDGAATVYQINEVSLRQGVTPERLLGRVNAGAQFLGLGAMLGGSLIGGWLAGSLGVRAMLFCGASGALLSTLWLLLSPVRTLRGIEGQT